MPLRPLRIAALTGGDAVPSARYRVRQLVAPLAREGIAVEELPAALSVYPPKSTLLRPLWLAGSLAQRLPQVLSTHRYDAVLLQRELISTLYTLERYTGRPRILDVDDALWLHPRGAFAGRLAASCEGVICGNNFLAEYFSRFNSRVEVIPTPVDTLRYAPAAPRPGGRQPVVGWVGTSSNFRYLYNIEAALKTFLERVPEARIRIMADRAPVFASLPASRVEYLPWSQAAEVAMIQGLTVGIMPLEDSEWARGKCSFKMLLYMSCAVPVVVSPVGMNREVLGQGLCGYGVETEGEWVEALESLCGNPVQAHGFGGAGRDVVMRHYSVDVVAPLMASALRGIAGLGERDAG